ncbi:unnamed protein product [Rhizophagus irregularis]|nr:unnamed protein product [Rhizophagus irregularis]CAB5189040.1 unnamed protein product [Rhizophagus irregularis]CAG8596120.1 7694_t:CDS:2 [Rhizophagus irregularis]
MIVPNFYLLIEQTGRSKTNQVQIELAGVDDVDHSKKSGNNPIELLDSSLDLEAGIDKMMSHLMKYLIEDESTQEELRKANRSEVKLNICWKILSIKRMEEQRKRETERKEREDRRQTGIEFTNF